MSDAISVPIAIPTLETYIPLVKARVALYIAYYEKRYFVYHLGVGRGDPQTFSFSYVVQLYCRCDLTAVGNGN